MPENESERDSHTKQLASVPASQPASFAMHTGRLNTNIKMTNIFFSERNLELSSSVLSVVLTGNVDLICF